MRRLRRDLWYVAVNVIGLGLALGFATLAFLNYRFANTYDHWHRDGQRIGRVEMKKTSDGWWHGRCPGPVATAAPAELPQVESSLRYDASGTVVKRRDAVFNEVLHYADAHFFGFFDFEVLAGVADLSDRSKVVISREMAEKYFGQTNAVGQTLLFNADAQQPLPLTVGGVLRDMPKNSSLRFSCITHLDNVIRAGDAPEFDTWKRSVGAIFLKLKSENDFLTVEKGLQAYVAPRNAARPDWQISAYRLTPFRALSAGSEQLRNNMLWPGLPPAAVWGNLTMALLLLLTAALNFSNMTISTSNRRLREMGVRKVLGGSKTQLTRQLLFESLGIVALATLFGMAVARPIADWHNRTWQFTDIQVDYTDPQLAGFTLLILLTTTLLAGSYPAFYLAGFRPTRIFRGSTPVGGKSHFSRIMLGLQMAISVLAIVVGVSFAHNAERNRNADIGFDYRPVLQAWLPKAGEANMFEQAIRDIPGITQTANSLHLPYFGYDRAEFMFRERPQEAKVFEVGNGFAALMDIRLVAGTWPAPAGDTVASPDILLNETLVRQMGMDERSVVGENLLLGKTSCRVAGVVRDFMTDTPFDPVAPTLLKTIPDRDCRRVLIKTAPTAQQSEVMQAIEHQWRALFPYTPFNVGYQSEMLREAIQVSDNIAYTMGVLSGVAVLLSIIGLFSLVSLEALRRMREVAIRRVVGAQAGHIGWILHKDYALIFVAALGVGCIGGWFLSGMLMDSIFLIHYGVPAYALWAGSSGMLGLALLTIALKTAQTLRTNPANILRGD